MDLWDDEACRTLAARHVQRAREAGALTMLPFALNYVAVHHIFAGEFTAAAALLEEADAITEATGNARMADFSLLLAGWRGQATGQFDAAVQDAAAARQQLSERTSLSGSQWAHGTDPPTQLTARETQIARLASDGLSNRQIAAQVPSPRHASVQRPPLVAR